MFPSANNLLYTPLVESIRLDPEGPVNLDYHQARFDRSRGNFYPDAPPVDLRGLLEGLPLPPGNGRYKVRIVYDREIREVTYRSYSIRCLERIWMVEDDSIDYRYKYLDRSSLEELKRSAVPPEKADAEDVLIIKNGLVTDTTFSNVALFDGDGWVTPESYLLPGTRRSELIESGRVRAVQVKAEDIGKYRKISFINAMLDLGELCLSSDSARG